MKRILIPVDGSDAALRAVKVAIDAVIERTERPQVHLVTVQPPILSGNVTRFFTKELIDEYYQEEGEKALVSARQLLKDAGIEFHEQILIGPVATAIIDHAEQEKCDHIVMGTRGLGALTSVVLGSVTTKVLSLTPVPITLVP
ncbi:MAG TPA: universal stress protein [Burkholderiaceae bacterium]|nr:universal stress protein [Burkholderiaceae bacterium]